VRSTGSSRRSVLREEGRREGESVAALLHTGREGFVQLIPGAMLNAPLDTTLAGEEQLTRPAS
jgi:hypothetical protein